MFVRSFSDALNFVTRALPLPAHPMCSFELCQDPTDEKGGRCSRTNAAPASEAPRLLLLIGGHVVVAAVLNCKWRPPTWEEVKEDMPRGPDVDPDLLDEPAYKSMTQEEAIDLVQRGLLGSHMFTPCDSVPLAACTSMLDRCNCEFPRTAWANASA